MTGQLSSLLATQVAWFAPSALALTAAAVLSGWWLGVVLRTVRDQTPDVPGDDLIEARFR